MACARSGELMVIDIFFDLMEAESRMGMDTARCLNCGNYEDTIIRTNRARSRGLRPFEPHTVGTRRSALFSHARWSEPYTRKVASRVPPRSCPFFSWRGPFRQNTDVRLRSHRISRAPSYRPRRGVHERHKLCLWERSLRNVVRTMPVPATAYAFSHCVA